jgi:hypothetical protein
MLGVRDQQKVSRVALRACLSLLSDKFLEGA